MTGSVAAPAADLLDLLLAGGVVAVALVTLLVRAASSAVLGFLVMGVLLTVVWARLSAPDVALAEAVIASGVTGAILVAALTESTEPADGAHCARTGLARVVAMVLGAAAVALVAAPVVAGLLATPAGADEQHLSTLASRTVDDAVLDHPVTVVLLEYRAYDTLMEIAVLATAVVVALALHHRGDLRGIPAITGTGTALDVVVRAAAPVLVLLAGWLLVAGSSQPGGAFQAGAMLTGLLLLLHLTGQRLRPPVGRLLRPLLVAGLGLFVVLGALTLAIDGRWLAPDGPGSATVVILLEAVLAVGIGVGLFALVLAGRPDRRDEGAHR